MNLYIKDNPRPERGEDVGKALIEMINENLKIADWKYHLVFTKFDRPSNIKIIYESEWCRVKFIFSRQDIPFHDELSIDYGRPHAKNEEPYMEWQGEKCRCWHNINTALLFLDNLSPLEAMRQTKIQKQSPVIIERFKKSEIGQTLLNEYPPKSLLVMHSVVWQHYGQRLFDLFDLRKPDLWESYRMFAREYYNLMGMKASLGPPYENVC